MTLSWSLGHRSSATISDLGRYVPQNANLIAVMSDPDEAARAPVGDTRRHVGLILEALADRVNPVLRPGFPPPHRCNGWNAAMDRCHPSAFFETH
jgi:benzoylformate decarboxylase